MKKENWLIASVAGVAAVAVILKVLTKRDIPEYAMPVIPFDMDRYLGKWHEVGRFESRIEKNLQDVTEEYSWNDDGTVKVVTRGYNTKRDQIVKAIGKIKFARANYVGMLKVSYFGPFYANYNVIDLDDDYRYALVCTNNLQFLWVLSREKTLPQEIKTRFINRALGIGFDVSKLEWV